ncbi:MAG: S6e family ribosomal protein, partial [Candidatus Nanoarchaeia archaeon]
DLTGKQIGEKIAGNLISPDFEGYELEITGTSDKAGFPGLKDREGPQLRKVLLGYGKAMKQRPRKEGKKPTPNPKGLRLRKSVRGKEISEDTIQINLNVLKEGKKKFQELLKPEPAEEGKQENAEEQPAEKKEQ